MSLNKIDIFNCCQFDGLCLQYWLKNDLKVTGPRSKTTATNGFVCFSKLTGSLHFGIISWFQRYIIKIVPLTFGANVYCSRISYKIV